MPPEWDCWAAQLEGSSADSPHALGLPAPAGKPGSTQGFWPDPSLLSGPSCTHLPNLAGISTAPAHWPDRGKSLFSSRDPSTSLLGIR